MQSSMEQIIQELFDTICKKLNNTDLSNIKKVICKTNISGIFNACDALGITEEELNGVATVKMLINLLHYKGIRGLAKIQLEVVLEWLMTVLRRSDIILDIKNARQELSKCVAQLPLPVEITGPDAQEAFRKALEKGSKKVHRTRLMIVGQERVGKTSLMRSLTFQSFNGNEPPTEGISSSLICHIDIKHATSWHLYEEGDVSEDPTSFKREYQQSMAMEMDLNIQESIMEKVMAQQTWMTSGDAGLSAARSSSQAQVHAPTNGAAAPPQRSKRGISRSPDPQAVSQRVADTFKRRRLSGYSFEPIVLSIWDFAGQDLYYTTHQTFLSSRAIYVIVFNLCHDLESPAPVPANSKPGNGHGSHGMTPIQYLDFWLRSVFTYTKENFSQKRLEQKSPPIFIVGTHRNSVGGENLPDEERKVMINYIFARIRRELCNKPYWRFVVNQFYAIENSLPCDSKKIAQLREHIECTARKEPYMGEDVPLRWLQFDTKSLREVARGRRHGTVAPVLTLKQVKDGFGINNETELLTMLKFYHDLGHIIYFGGDADKKSQALKDVVILNPQWLIDAFKKIITITPPRHQLTDHVQRWNRLKETGILEDKLIDHMWHDILSKKQALLDLMDKFDLLCERVDQPQEGANSSPEEVSYYVPSMLQWQASKSDQPESTQQQNSSTFFLDFQGFLPDGLFHRLVVRALRWSQTLGGTKPGLQYDCGRFYVNDQHEFELQMVRQGDLAFIRVNVVRAPTVNPGNMNSQAKPSSDILNKVHGFVVDNLQNLKDMWIKRINYCISVECPCRRDSLHFQPLKMCLEKPEVPCRIVKPQVTVKTDDIKAMFTEESSKKESELQEKSQQMHDVLFREIAKDLGSEWESLSSHLGFSQQDIYKFKTESAVVNNQIFCMLVKWRESRGGNVDRMTKELVEALQKIDKCELVDKVLRLGTISSPPTC